MIKVLMISLLLLLITSCTSKMDDQKEEEVLFYTVSTTRDFRTYTSDLIPMDSIWKHDENDTLLAHCWFELNGKVHWVNLYTNHPYAPIDGGYLAFELDTLGIIYAKSTTWKSYSRLKSTNDSINDLITTAFEQILLNDQFHKIDLSKLPFNRKTVKFLPATK